MVTKTGIHVRCALEPFFWPLSQRVKLLICCLDQMNGMHQLFTSKASLFIRPKNFPDEHCSKLVRENTIVGMGIDSIPVDKSIKSFYTALKQCLSACCVWKSKKGTIWMALIFFSISVATWIFDGVSKKPNAKFGRFPIAKSKLCLFDTWNEFCVWCDLQIKLLAMPVFTQRHKYYSMNE